MVKYSEKEQRNLRQEKKYILPSSHRESFINDIFEMGFFVHHDSGLVNNIYFDDYLEHSKDENINGDMLRKKIRLRWYNNEEKYILEEKMKRSSSGFKKRRIVDKEEVFKDLADRNFEPVIQNRYRRQYFVNPRGVRLTIDEDICFKYPDTAFWRQFEHSIVEIKFDTKEPVNLSKILPSDLQLTKFSKFVNGIELLNK